MSVAAVRAQVERDEVCGESGRAPLPSRFRFAGRSGESPEIRGLASTAINVLSESLCA